MNIRKLAMLATLSFSLASAPVMAQMSNGRSASIQRAGVELSETNQIRGSTAIVAILALAAVIGGAIFLSKGKNTPTSP